MQHCFSCSLAAPCGIFLKLFAMCEDAPTQAQNETATLKQQQKGS
jgi:hypothetical protein